MRPSLGKIRLAIARSWLLIWMLTSIGLVLTVAVWSAAKERADSLADFSGRQHLLAIAVAIDLEQRFLAHEPSTAAVDRELSDEVIHNLLSGARRLETPHSLAVLVARPGAMGFLTTDGRLIPSTRLGNALVDSAESVVVPRDEAATFGFPRRTAIAGIAPIQLNGRGNWGVVVLASAQRLRDRQILEERRLALTVAVVTVVVAAFGVLARRRERHKLELERRMAISNLEHQREAALAHADKMAALAALSTGIAHEVGTPLGVIVGRVEQVMDRTVDERSRGALGIVLEQVDRIYRIVKGCLAMARGEAPELIRTLPADLAKGAVDLVQHRFDNAGVDLECTIVTGLPAVACEPALFEQALVNVLLNACEATPKGGQVRLAVALSNRTVQFVIDDEGEGIPDDVAQRATEPFFSTRLGKGGSGLGLTIANEIITHHAGAFTIHKLENGKGTRAMIAISI